MTAAPARHPHSANTRAALLDAAAREIRRRGYQPASVSRILAETGVTKGALYHHFASKLDLGYAVFDERFVPEMRTLWIEPLQACDGDPVQLLIDIIRDAGAQMTDADVALGCPINNLAQEMSPVDAGFRERIALALEAWRAAIEEALDRGLSHGLLQVSVDTRAAATFIVASLEGCIGMAKNAQSAEILRQCGDGLVAYLRTLQNRT
ncbi:MAG: TetR family transcriptional regulator [Gammaproteobacteria bacterium]|nr:TetR family transcriptional regulator [Gammaproteobacteria bacterium]